MRLWKLWFEADFSFSVHIWLQVSIDLTLTSLINQSLQQSSPESSSFWNPADSWCHSYSMLTLKQEQTVFSRPGHGESKSEQQLSWPRVGTPPSATSEHRDLRLGGGGSHCQMSHQNQIISLFWLLTQDQPEYNTNWGKPAVSGKSGFHISLNEALPTGNNERFTEPLVSFQSSEIRGKWNIIAVTSCLKYQL